MAKTKVAAKAKVDPILKEKFEQDCLKGTCFDSLEELLSDKTDVHVNAPRALIAVSLKGAWQGLQYGYALGQQKKK